jgi:hypothetical protein
MILWILGGWLAASCLLAWLFSRWQRFLRGDFDVNLPSEVDMDELVGDREYVEGARWSVFVNLDPAEPPGRNVLIVLGDRWTVLRADDFRMLAQRILPQL